MVSYKQKLLLELKILEHNKCKRFKLSHAGLR